MLYTRCTHCDATLRLRAASLRAAVGHVRCGSCYNVFNALVHLDDVAPVPLDDGDDWGTDTRFELVEPDEPTSTGDVPDDRPDASESTESAESAPNAMPQEASAALDPPTAQAPTLDQLSQIEDVGRDEEPKVGELRDVVTAETSAQSLSLSKDDDIPDVLRGDIDRISKTQNPVRRVVAVSVAIALLVGLAAQHVWFNPQDVMRQYPQWAMYVDLFCQHTKCDLPRSDDRSQLKLLSRQVSIHPTYEGAIQVTAVMQNDGLGAQTYPQIRFSLFNVNGDTIASRLFRPDEYLGEQYRPDLSIKSGGTATIRLDLIAPEDTAVSFEFEFI